MPPPDPGEVLAFSAVRCIFGKLFFQDLHRIGNDHRRDPAGLKAVLLAFQEGGQILDVFLCRIGRKASFVAFYQIIVFGKIDILDFILSCGKLRFRLDADPAITGGELVTQIGLVIGFKASVQDSSR